MRASTRHDSTPRAKARPPGRHFGQGIAARRHVANGIALRRRRSGRPIAPALLLALLASSGVPGATAAQEVGIAVGTPAPAAEVQDLEGNPLQLRDLFEPGKPVLLEFWATWCEVCEALQPEMDRVQERYGERVTVIAVAVGVAQTLRRVNRHLEDHPPAYRYVWDANGAAVRAYEAPTTSAVVLLDGEGKVAYTGVGADQELVATVERVLSRSPGPTPPPEG